MQECNKCGATWETAQKKTQCPFCGADLSKNKETSTIEEAFAELVSVYGKEIIIEDRKLIGLLSDIVPELEKERRLVEVAMRAGAYKELYMCEAGDEIRIFEKCVRNLNESFFIEEDKARRSLMWCADAISMELPSYYAEQKVQDEPVKIENGHGNNSDQGGEVIVEKKRSTSNLQLEVEKPQTKKVLKKYNDGSVYVGEWSDGCRNGYGTWTRAYTSNNSAVSEIYEGEWKDDKLDGFVIRTYASGDYVKVEEGFYKDGVKDGHFIVRDKKHGSIEEGDYKEGEKDGCWIARWPNGFVEEHNYKDGQLHGMVKYVIDGKEFIHYYENGKEKKLKGMINKFKKKTE